MSRVISGLAAALVLLIACSGADFSSAGSGDASAGNGGTGGNVRQEGGSGTSGAAGTTAGSGGSAGTIGAAGAVSSAGATGVGGSGAVTGVCWDAPMAACDGMTYGANGWDGQCQPIPAPTAQLVSQPGTGCSDGTREAMFGVQGVAACSGGWSVPGVKNIGNVPVPPHCGRKSGNSSANPIGDCCSATDLCAAGWHVCRDMGEVMTKTGGQGCVMNGSPGFFITAQGMTSVTPPLCAPGTFNNLVGCSSGMSLGGTPDPGCAPLDRYWRRQDCCCAASAGWWCNDSYRETQMVRKSSALGGGVLCCVDG